MSSNKDSTLNFAKLQKSLAESGNLSGMLFKASFRVEKCKLLMPMSCIKPSIFHVFESQLENGIQIAYAHVMH